MLKRISSPEIRGVKLTRTDSDDVVTESGWHVRSYRGDDGNWYEHAQRSEESRWYLLEV